MARRTIEEWRKLVTEWETSGRTQKDWCKSKGINEYTFRDKVMRIRKESDKKIEAGKIKEEADDKSGEETNIIKWKKIESKEEKAAAADILIRCGDFEIVPREGFDEENLARICKVLVSI